MSLEAKALTLLRPTFTIILTSPLVRARQTAEIVHDAFPTLDLVEEPALSPGFALRAFDKLMRRHTAHPGLLLVGHEPDFSAVIGGLIGKGRVEMKKGAVAHLKAWYRPDKHMWRGELLWLATPALLGATVVGATSAS
jgi:phosphohistidine phosphatase